MSDLSARLSELHARLAQVEFLTSRTVDPERWNRLDRAQRLYRTALALPDGRARPPLVVLLGGTNTGKSTLYNLLLGEAVALPAGTAAATRAVALSVPEAAAELFASRDFLPDFDRRPWSGPAPLNEPGPPRLFLHRRAEGPAVALADTPDVDSVEIANRHAAEMLFFAAEAVIFVASDQKYADEACLRLQAAAPRFRKAVLVVCNRTAPDSAAFADLVDHKLPAVGLAGAPVVAIPNLPPAALEPGGVIPDPVAGVGRWLAERVADPGLAERAHRGRILGYSDAVGTVVEPLAQEASGVEKYLAGVARLIEQQADAYEPAAELDELEEAMLEAMEELRVPGLDWAYEQVGHVRRRVRSALAGLRTRFLQRYQQAPVVDPQVAAEDRERRQLDQMLHKLVAGRQKEAGQAPDELQPALFARLPAVPSDAVEDYLGRQARERREIVDAARQKILAEIDGKKTKIKIGKGVARGALLTITITELAQTGGLSPSEVVLTPMVDALAKYALEHLVDKKELERLRQDVLRRRRRLLADWLEATLLTPLQAALPASCQPEFVAALGDGLEALRAAVEETG